MAGRKGSLGKAARPHRRREKRSAMPLKKRALSRFRAMKIGRIRSRRRKQVAKAEHLLQKFEKSLAKLESDHLAIALFRKRRIPKIESEIAKIKDQLNVLVKQAAKHLAANENGKAKKIWQQEHILEERERALQAELRLIKGLK